MMSGYLSLPKRALPIARDRRHQKAQNASHARLDLDARRHAGSQLYHHPVDVHLPTFENYAGSKCCLLRFFVTSAWLAASAALRISFADAIPCHGVARNAFHLAANK